MPDTWRASRRFRSGNGRRISKRMPASRRRSVVLKVLRGPHTSYYSAQMHTWPQQAEGRPRGESEVPL